MVAGVGVGVALVYSLSVLAHELGHLAAARLVGVEVAAIELHAAGGFVEMNGDDALTAGKLVDELVAMHKTVAGLQDDVQSVTDRLPDASKGPLQKAHDVLTGGAADPSS